MLEARKVSQEVGKSIPWKFVELRTWWWLGGFFKKQLEFSRIGKYHISRLDLHKPLGDWQRCGGPVRKSSADLCARLCVPGSSEREVALW